MPEDLDLLRMAYGLMANQEAAAQRGPGPSYRNFNQLSERMEEEMPEPNLDFRLAYSNQEKPAAPRAQLDYPPDFAQPDRGLPPTMLWLKNVINQLRLQSGADIEAAEQGPVPEETRKRIQEGELGALIDATPMAPMGLGIMYGARGALNLGRGALERLIAGARAYQQGTRGQALWKNFGVSRGTEGRFKGEISDVLARVRGEGETLGDVLEHPELFRAYPDLARTPVAVRIGAPRGGSYQEIPEMIRASGETPEDVKDILMHEIQHGVQRREKFAVGGSPREEILPGEEIAASADPDMLVNVMQKLGLFSPRAIRYGRLAGEVEARNVQARLAEPDLMQFSPEWTADLPPELQIVKRNLLQGPR